MRHAALLGCLAGLLAAPPAAVVAQGTCDRASSEARTAEASELREGRPHVYYSLVHDGGGVKFSVPIPEGVEVRWPPAKPEGFGIELADAVIRIFDLSEHMGIDISEMLQIKMQYNKTRPFQHGGKKL